MSDADKRVAALERKYEDLVQKLRRGDFAEGVGGGSDGLNIKSLDVGTIEWKIENIANEIENVKRGDSIWSPVFSARGYGGLQLEVFPNGRETTLVEGFCSIFLWCPGNLRVRYQLGVGSYERAPDKDVYDGRMGHGHSNFCHLASQIESDGSATVRCKILDVQSTDEPEKTGNGELRLLQGARAREIEAQVAVVRNQNVRRVEWRVTNFSKRRDATPKGHAIYSPIFSVAGIDEILLEFYPNGSQNTTKENQCAYYLRCPGGSKVVVSLFVGGYKRGPIAASFEGAAGKGLPDFCPVEPEVGADDTLLIGLDIQNSALEREGGTLMLEDTREVRAGRAEDGTSTLN